MGKKLVLLVEDEPAIREPIAAILRDDGYEVETASDGSEALDYLRSTTRDPCLVLCDLMMPKLSGDQLIEILRREDRFVALPILVMTASADAKIGHGVRVFRKPLPLDELLDAIEEHCRPDDQWFLHGPSS